MYRNHLNWQYISVIYSREFLVFEPVLIEKQTWDNMVEDGKVHGNQGDL